MKITGYSRRWPHVGTWLPALMLAGGLLVSCGKDDTVGNTTSLPEGMYPLKLTAEVAQQPQTRAGGKDTWTGGEEIGVMLEGIGMPKT